MGRYYSGDIEGKFWFGVQASTDADFFGVNGNEPNYIEYYFDKDNLEDIKKGIRICREKLGDNKEKLDKFFEANFSYNNTILKEHIGVSNPQNLLEWYARLELGERILKCVEEQGECSFTAEL